MVASSSPCKGASQALAVTHARRSLSFSASKELPVNQPWLALVPLLCLKLPNLPLRQSVAPPGLIQGEGNSQSCYLSTICTHKLRCMFAPICLRWEPKAGLYAWKRTCWRPTKYIAHSVKKVADWNNAHCIASSWLDAALLMSIEYWWCSVVWKAGQQSVCYELYSLA